MIHSKRNSYVTAASTPKEAKYGYIFKHCKLTAEPGVDKVYLGRPWRPYAYTLFINILFLPDGTIGASSLMKKQPVIWNIKIPVRAQMFQKG